MKIKNEIRRGILSSMFTGLIGILAIFIMALGTRTTPKSFIEFIKGYKEMPIKKIENFVIPKYNTSITYAKELIDLNVDYEKYINKNKSIKTKLYLVKTENGNFYYIPDPDKKIEKNGNDYIIKGTLKLGSSGFLNNYAYAAYEKLPNDINQPFLIIDQLDNWKSQGIIIFSVIGIILLALFLFYVKQIASFINIKYSLAYKNLKNYGDPDRLLNLIEKELNDSNYKATETENWYIIRGYYNTLFIPKDLIIGTYSYRLGKKGNVLHLFEYTGDSRKISVNNSTLDRILFSISNSIKPIDMSDNEKAKNFANLRILAEKDLKDYKENRNMLFEDIQNGKNTHPIFEFKSKFIKLIEEN